MTAPEVLYVVGSWTSMLVTLLLARRVHQLLTVERRRTVLELLGRGGGWTGLDLVDASQGLLKRGTVYVLLARMEQEGLITSWEGPDARRRYGLPVIVGPKRSNS